MAFKDGFEQNKLLAVGAWGFKTSKLFEVFLFFYLDSYFLKEILND